MILFCTLHKTLYSFLEELFRAKSTIDVLYLSDVLHNPNHMVELLF